MTFLRGFLRFMAAFIVANAHGVLAQRVSYGWDGTQATANTQSAYIDVLPGWQTIAAGANFQNGGWVDLLNVGRPFFMFIIEANGTGQRNVEVVIEYGRFYNVNPRQILKTRIARELNLANVEYQPKTLLWNIPLLKEYGHLARVKSITNNGDMSIDVECQAPSSAQPVDDGVISVLDYEVIEEDSP